MRKIFFILLTFPLIFACSKDDDNNKKDSSVYYIKYYVKSSSMYIGKIDIAYKAENNQNKTEQALRSGTWERVVGPVSKGFNASLRASDPRSDLYHLKLSVKISVSKDGSQFADKGVDFSDNDRSSAQTSYTIDY